MPSYRTMADVFGIDDDVSAGLEQLEAETEALLERITAETEAAADR